MALQTETQPPPESHQAVTGRSGRVSAWRSPELAVDDDLIQSALESGELLIIELSDEEFGDGSQMDRSGLGEACHAGVSQRDDNAACVRIGIGSADAAFPDQAGDTAGHAGARDERPGRELRHA